ncbi:MAG: hypothetical protein ACOYBR_09605 [Fluviibacter sp.]
MVRLERDIESECRALVRMAGGRPYKWTSPGAVGVPDQLCFLPGGALAIAEIKRIGQPLKPKQREHYATLQSLGFVVRRVTSVDEMRELIHAAEYARRNPQFHAPTWPLT